MTTQENNAVDNLSDMVFSQLMIIGDIHRALDKVKISLDVIETINYIDDEAIQYDLDDAVGVLLNLHETLIEYGDTRFGGPEGEDVADGTAAESVE